MVSSPNRNGHCTHPQALARAQALDNGSLDLSPRFLAMLLQALGLQSTCTERSSTSHSDSNTQGRINKTPGLGRGKGTRAHCPLSPKAAAIFVSPTPGIQNPSRRLGDRITPSPSPHRGPLSCDVKSLDVKTTFYTTMRSHVLLTVSDSSSRRETWPCGAQSQCYGLNVCIPPEFIWEILTPHAMVSGGVASGRS